MNDSFRSQIMDELNNAQQSLLNDCRRLVQVPSPNPSGDTRAIAALVKEMVQDIPGLKIESHSCETTIQNLVLRLDSGKPGKRLVFNGHLDTFPVGDESLWNYDPFGGECVDGKLYGRGACDMKGGIASSLQVLRLLAKYRDSWQGEVVMTLAGDEESMGKRGTLYLLENVENTTGDAMICADVGSPQVLRFGEKGMIWLDLFATGKASHGAHVHKGINAIERLTEAMRCLKLIESMPVQTPDVIKAAIVKAAPVSEPLGGAGESEVLQKVTINFGHIQGGVSPNLVADKALLGIDIRIPVGVKVAVIESWIEEMISPLEGVSYEITRRYEANWSNPEHEIFKIMQQHSQNQLDCPTVCNMRVGASDARLYRLFDIPTVVSGLSPHNLGGADEYVDIQELNDLTVIHALTAFDFLNQAQ